ncbi:hypothetical protein Tco_1419731 [Tanacetum coccineum]
MCRGVMKFRVVAVSWTCLMSWRIRVIVADTSSCNSLSESVGKMNMVQPEMVRSVFRKLTLHLTRNLLTMRLQLVKKRYEKSSLRKQLPWKNVDEIVQAASELPDVKVRSVFSKLTLHLQFQLCIPQASLGFQITMGWFVVFVANGVLMFPSLCTYCLYFTCMYNNLNKQSMLFGAAISGGVVAEMGMEKT